MNLFGRKTFESVIAPLAQIESDLRQLAEDEMASAIDKQAEAERLIEEVKQHDAEADKCLVVADRMKHFMSVGP